MAFDVTTIIIEIYGRATIYNHEKLKGLLNTISAKMIMNQNTFFRKLSVLLLHFSKLIRITYNKETKFCNFRNAIPFTILLGDLEVKSTPSFEATKTIFVCNCIASYF